MFTTKTGTSANSFKDGEFEEFGTKRGMANDLPTTKGYLELEIV